MKGKKISLDDFLDLLRARGCPVTNVEIAIHLECTSDTARRAASKARREGFTVLPTQRGQWYVTKIKSADELNLLLESMDWAARGKVSMNRLAPFFQRVLATTPKKLEYVIEEHSA